MSNIKWPNRISSCQNLICVFYWQIKGDSISEYIQLAIKTTDPLVLKHAIISYNSQQPKSQNDQAVNIISMQTYWTNKCNLNSIIHPTQQIQFQMNLKKLNSINDIDFTVIALAKIDRLKKVHVRPIFFPQIQNYNLYFGMPQISKRNTIWQSILSKAWTNLSKTIIIWASMLSTKYLLQI